MIVAFVLLLLIAAGVFAATARRYGCEKRGRGITDCVLATLGFIYAVHYWQLGTPAWFSAAIAAAGYALGSLGALLFGPLAVKHGLFERRQ